jgi:uncharacterized protein (TIGR03118 family)
MSNWKNAHQRAALGALVLSGLLLGTARTAAADDDTVYVQTNLVSDLPGVAAQMDPNLVNPWGISASATSPLWVANNATGTSTLYNGAGQLFPVASPLVVTIPPPAGGSPPAAPTGTVFNGTGTFLVAPGKPGLFLFATEDGTISGWNPAVSAAAVLKVDNSGSGAVYKGLALGQNASGPMLYATNFHAGTVDAFDSTFTQVTVSGGFMDRRLPEGYAPFGILAAGDKLYVTYALQDADRHDDVAGSSHGFVDVFDMDGNLLRRLASRGHLNSPWGLAIAPAGFGEFSGALLVGNFGDGTIHAYDLDRGEFRGTLRNTSHRPVTILGLWSIRFGNGGSGGAVNSLFFTAGLPDETGALEKHGLLGVLNAQLDDRDHDGD